MDPRWERRHEFLSMGESKSQTTLRHAAAPTPGRPPLCLRRLAGPGPDLPLSARLQVLGRGEKADLRVDDPALSRQHFSLMAQDDVACVADLGSSNGTFVDGRRIDGTTELERGAILAAGDSLWGFDPEVPEEQLPALPEADPEVAYEVVGASPLTVRLRRSLATVGPLVDNVLLLGPTGSGKEVAARSLHRISQRKGAFIPVNCAAVPPSLAESLLFGHVKGAFTGAGEASPGFFRKADRGTLFLDEIGELPEPTQAKLLRVVEEGEVWPVGGTEPVQVDVRLVAATHRDLGNSGFRDDLYARLSDWVLGLPPLRLRLGDAPILLEKFLSQLERPPELDIQTREALCVYDWPLNIRQVKKLAQRLRVLAPEGAITPQSLPTALSSLLVDRSLRTEEDADGGPTKGQLEAALRAAKGNLARAARDRGWHRTQLYRWLERYGLDPRDFRGQ